MWGNDDTGQRVRAGDDDDDLRRLWWVVTSWAPAKRRCGSNVCTSFRALSTVEGMEGWGCQAEGCRWPRSQRRCPNLFSH